MTALPPCSALAAQAYRVPLPIIENVAAHSTANGIGIMRIDPRWLPILQRVGFDPVQVTQDACMNVAAGTWILAWAGAAKHGAAESAQQRTPPAPSAPISKDLAACVSDAARKYHLPEILYRAILMTEGGRVGKVSRNPNGSYDMGPAQVNSSHLRALAGMGITREQIINDGCLNVHVGAWILADALGGRTPDNPAEFWKRVGNYNSHTPRYNVAYQHKVWENVRIAAQSHTPAPS